MPRGMDVVRFRDARIRLGQSWDKVAVDATGWLRRVRWGVGRSDLQGWGHRSGHDLWVREANHRNQAMTTRLILSDSHSQTVPEIVEIVLTDRLLAA